MGFIFLGYDMDLIGKKFGKLTILARDLTIKKNRPYWICICDCGQIKTVSGTNLKSGYTKSCGCLRKESAKINGRKTILNFGDAALNALYGNYKRKALKKNLIFGLTREDFKSLTSSNCFYCDIIPLQTYQPKHNNGSYIYNGIDRVDNSKGYILENCVSCCGNCNNMKSNISLKMINKIYNYTNNLFI